LNQNVKKKNIIITANLQQVQEKQQNRLETEYSWDMEMEKTESNM
jgi:hypothetical protein